MSDTATITLRLPNKAADDTATPSEVFDREGGVERADLADTTTPHTARYRQMAMQFPKASGNRRDALRNSLIKAIRHPPFAESPSSCIAAVIDGFLGSKQAGRLDDAIDILAHAGPDLDRFALEAGGLVEGDQYDDFWFVVVQALSRATRSEVPHSRIDWALHSNRRQLMEAAIRSLAERGDAISKNRLERLANQHHSEFIRKLALEALEDCLD
jgi:hypothetical protein